LIVAILCERRRTRQPHGKSACAKVASALLRAALNRTATWCGRGFEVDTWICRGADANGNFARWHKSQTTPGATRTSPQVLGTVVRTGRGVILTTWGVYTDALVHVEASTAPGVRERFVG
jgi:hypothetical protein